MTSRERKNSVSDAAAKDASESKIEDSVSNGPVSKTRRKRRGSTARDLRRRNLFQSLEQRQLLAGPQLIGIQPNEGALITDGSVRDTSPRVLTFGFDENQVIDTGTLDGIQISRSGEDGQLGTADDVRIAPGLVTLGDPNENEVVVRFAESLPDDDYRIELFGFDDAGLGIRGLKNSSGEFFVPNDPTQRSQRVDFRLALGALVESVVPQPVVRSADGSLSQNRDEVVVYFNEDPLFVEDDDNGVPTIRSAEHPRFYQLLLTNDTVRTTDDVMFNPEQVVYDEATHTARLFFGEDINALPGVPLEGGTWRLRIGTAVDERVDLILPPTQVAVQPLAVTDFQYDGLRVEFVSNQVGEGASGQQVSFVDTGAGGLSVGLDGSGNIVFDFGGDTPTVDDLKTVVSNTPVVSGVLAVRSERNGDVNEGGDLVVPQSVVGAPALSMQAAGETLTTSLDVGVFGQDNSITSLVVRESIDPQSFGIELQGGNDDPGHRELDGAGGELRRHINPDFGADTLDGITEIAYNFQGIFDSIGQTDFLNQINETQKQRIREVLNLWAAKLGVQFRETLDQGITFAVGDTTNLQPRPNTTLVRPQSAVGSDISRTLEASLRIDSTFAESAVVFSNQADFALDYGEEFTRKAAAGVGFMLGLEQASDLPPQTLMALVSDYLNEDIDTAVNRVDLEPVFPGNYDVIHGQYVHRTDSVDIDLYRFEVELGDADKVGTLTAETFAERLADSSLLDTTLALYQEVRASVETDLGFGSTLGITFESLLTGRAGNGIEVRFIQSDRGVNDGQVRVNRVFSDSGEPIPNAILLDLPRSGPTVLGLTAEQVVAAVNDDPFASSILRAEVTKGDPQFDLLGGQAAPLPVRLSGGGLAELAKNDDYFSEDSRIIASLGEGVYYVGVSASGNDTYDPTIPGSGFGGRTQGLYDLHLKFEPQVDEVDVIRDMDSERPGVPGTPLDGDADGVAGGAHNFWFQTRALNRQLNFTDDGEAVVVGQTVTVISGNNVERTYEFVPIGGTAVPGNIAVSFSDGLNSSIPTPAGNLAAALASQINFRQGETGVSVNILGTRLEFVGERSIELSDDFRAGEAIGRNVFVDKTAGPNADGSLDRPFNNIANSQVANAFGSVLSGDIVRIVGNGGLDGDLATESDNFSYQIGISDVGGNALTDGRAMEVPKGVTTMIDAGAILKLRASYISVGSSTLLVDRSQSALQILGTPRLVDLNRTGDPLSTTLAGDEDSENGGYDDGSVIITSIRDRLADASTPGNSPDAQAGDWGGLIYRRDLDEFEGRRDLEDEGIFLQRVNHAELRYGGSSNVLIDSIQQVVNPILVVNMRPTITFNEITSSADSAISASPDSFEETSYQAPRFQQAGAFTADYDRVGPEISNNELVNNTVNGLFIRVPTTATQTPRELTVSGRFDDIDIVHVLPENLVIASKPGGSIEDGFSPSMSLVSARKLPGGSLQTGTYIYKMTFVDEDGFESKSSIDQFSFLVDSDTSSIELTGLPLVSQQSGYVSRRLYRADATAGSDFRLIADLDASATNYIDDLAIAPGQEGQVFLDQTRRGIRGRLDGSLVMDPGLVMKLSGSRIELQPGSVLLAEGDASNPIALTSLRDDRFGAGGTFDTNNDALSPVVQDPAKGDWAGIYAGPTSAISIDNGVISYAGGISLIEGGETRGFAPLQLQQADGRVTNTRFEFNDSGQDGAGPAGRFGRLSTAPATIFVRGSQPILVGNSFIDNDGSIIDIDSDSLTAERVIDVGRQTGALDRFAELDDNFGPLVRFNRYEDNDLPGLNQITGMEIRGGTIATESVWDDTDIVHLVFDTIVVDNFHSGGGLKLRSRPDESLVVKLGDQSQRAVDGWTSGQGTPNSATIGTGLTASGTPNDATDRLGGAISILGLPDAPVVLTSFRDDTVGAGLTPKGTAFTDSNGDKTNSRPESNDWRSILLDQYSSDRNVDVIPELELSTESAPGLNGSIGNAQVLGELASKLTASDEVLRLGFEVEGFLSNPDDVDTYSFIGSPGTEVWVDIDKTSFTLDTVVELMDSNGNILARSDNSGVEIANGSEVDVFDPRFEGVTTSLLARDQQYGEFGAGGVYEDYDTTNPRDAGIHFTLTGNTADPSARSTYFFRVRSASLNPDDSASGLTKGGYRLQVRLTEDQEFAGSVIRYSDIRYANHGVHVQGLLGSSPLLGEASENEAWVENDGDRESFRRDDANNDFLENDFNNGGFFNFGVDAPQRRAQNLGNLIGNRNNVISVAGELSDLTDVDFYQIDVMSDDINNAIRSTVFDIDYADGFNRPDTNISVFFDPDGEFGPEQPRLILHGTDSNVLDDLTSPNGENDATEKLDRGSVATGDPLVGPVTLVEGTYYVAVTGEGQEPSVFSTSPSVRIEPINSVRRIAEERFGGDESSTASGPVVDELFTTDAINDAGFGLFNDFNTGHGRPSHYDGSFGQFGGASQLIPEFVVAAGFDAADSFGGPIRATSLDTLDWSVEENEEIGGDFGGFSTFGFSENTSNYIPHVSIGGSLQADRVDFYEFTLDQDFGRVILDIDHGFNGDTLLDSGDPLTPFEVIDPSSIDTTMYLYQEQVDLNGVGLGTYIQRSTSTFSNVRDGRLGSESLASSGSPFVSVFDNDPFMDFSFLSAGIYVVGIAQSQVNVTLDSNGLPQVANTDPILTGVDYTLHVSVEDHELPQLANPDLVLGYDRANSSGPGTLSSTAFDLAGYSAEDLPKVYFNYRSNAEFGDTVVARMISDQNPFGSAIGSAFFNDNNWRQMTADIGAFAGHTNVQLQFTYTPGGGTGAAGQGFFIDDVIVGFAERGETVFNAPAGGTTFNGGSSGDGGEYQLEVRPGTEYATSLTVGTSLQQDFDTNDRHTQSITMVAPAGDQVVDGDTFVMGDGSANLTFEFTDTPGTVEFGHTPVLFSSGFSPAEMAEAMRAAITLQTAIDIEASSSSGEDTGALTDGRLSLSGSARGTFFSVPTALDAPAPGTPLSRDADGHLLMPAILHDGYGDSNYLRTQGQVIIDSNTISDVRAIGVWSEPGVRDIDPEDRRTPDDLIFFDDSFLDFNDGIFFFGVDEIDGNHAFLEFPPVGNTYPGYARNLPTLNDSVKGGLTPGIVVSNNTIDNAGYSGVKVDGETAPFVLDVYELSDLFLGDDSLFEGFIGDVIEGSLLEIDAGGTRVTFEFDELNGNPPPSFLGSGVAGSNGVADGHVPIYYREDPVESAYNRPGGALRIAYSSHELAMSIMGAIQGSALVTNGLVELVTTTLGPSPYRRSLFNEQFQLTNSSYDSAAVYIEGATNVRFIPGFSASAIDISQAPVSESAQPFARIVNNTIYGSDGRESANPQDNTESNDLIISAIETKLGPSHRNVYTSDSVLGDNVGPVDSTGDVDFYQVNLGLGDRLVVDIDTVAGGANAALQIFNSRGERQSFQDLGGDVSEVSRNDTAPDYLDPLSTAYNTVADDNNGRDAFIDFFAPEKGVYYVAVSTDSNVDFEPDALSGRSGDAADLGQYTIHMETYAPRTGVISLDGGPALNPGNRFADKGITGEDVRGTSFTITQIPDLDPGAAPNARTNQVVYRFGGTQGPDEVAIAINDADRMHDIMRAISRAISPGNNSTLPNNDSDLAPGPISSARATALGGNEGDNPGINNLIREAMEQNPRIFFPHRDGIVSPSTYEFNTETSPTGEQIGFGHNVRTTPGNGTTEQFVYLENIAKIELSPEAIAAGVTLDPVVGFDTDQIINETGVMITAGASPALLNNVFLNLHESVVVAESRAGGFGTGGADQQVKPMEVVVVGSVFQHDETQPTLFNQKFSENVGLTTNANVGPSNVNGGTDDFNVTAADTTPVLVNPTGDNFLPAGFSPVIDSNVDSLRERGEFASLKESVGIPVSNVLAPTRDVSGVRRADNPLYPNTGQGSSVFGDRGSNELADRVGPIAIAEVPRDNDAEGLDTDPNVSFINLDRGVYEEFRIQLRDSGDASDPFTGSGIDSSTVVVAEIPGIRPSGSNVTLFEDDRLLVEGLDYTFNYDETKNIITLTPLAGIWNNDRAYRMELNNRDRTVIIAPDANQVSDGDQIRITDSNGGQVVFEFESGYLVQMPEALTVDVPREGTNQGGMIDGGIFTIDDGVNPVVVFEFDADGTTLPSSIPVSLPNTPTPTESEALDLFLAGIAVNIETAIQSVVDDPNTVLNVDVQAVGTSVVIGSEKNTRIDVATSGLNAVARTLGLQVPTAGADIGGVAVGETFELSDGNLVQGFQFVDVNNPQPGAGLIGVDISPSGGNQPVPLTADEVASRIESAILGSNLDLTPSILGRTVYLDLPVDGAATVPSGQLRVVGISRTPDDGDLIVFTPNDGSDQVVFEINRTDERDSDGNIVDDGVAQSNVPLDITRLTTGDELATLAAGAIQSRSIPGLLSNDVDAVEGGILKLGGQSGLGLSVSGSSLEVVGSPDVTGPSTLEVFGPLVLRIPFTAPNDGDTFSIEDPNGTPVVFEFDSNGVLVNPGASRVLFTRFDDQDTVSGSVVNAINQSSAGVTASYTGSGNISLGSIQEERVDTSSSSLSTQRGIVSDGEVLTISQGGISVSYEFESVNNGGGVNGNNVPIPFQPGSTTLDVANSLAAAIINNSGGLVLNPVVTPEGLIILNDLPGTVVDVTASTSLLLTGVPGGAIPVSISPGDTAFEIKQALLSAIESVNSGPEGSVTTLAGQDRGGATLFVENGVLFEGPVTTYFLPAIRDIQRNALEANRSDNTTQFTILMPTVGLDYGDAADPAFGVPGRYPTLLENDGPRHVVTDDLFLGTQIDADADGQASIGADGDDALTGILTFGTLFSVTTINGSSAVNVNTETVDPLLRDGDLIEINTGVMLETLEFDLNGRFDEDHYAIQPADPTSAQSILEAIVAAIEESPIDPAGVEIVSTAVVIDGDDEDGISFISERNPNGVLNKNIVTPITVTVTGSGILQGWVDYDADGNWSAAEAIQFYDEGADPATSTPRSSLSLTGDGSRSFTFDTYVPASAPDPLFATPAAARFRFSRSGDLTPIGLSLSGEVEDYRLLLLPGSPPTIGPEEMNRRFMVSEDQTLQALDTDGTLTPQVTTDDGLLAGVFDVDGDNVAIFPADTGIRQLFTASGEDAGELDLNGDGTFTFRPVQDFNGSVSFTARVTDIKTNQDEQLVNDQPITVTIDVLPVNDKPYTPETEVEINTTIDEDAVTIFRAEDLIDPFYLPGPPNEAGQPLVFQSVSSANNGESVSMIGGTLEIIDNGRSVRYTPPADFFGGNGDVFNFTVADVPGGNLIPLEADKPGTVAITIDPINDPPVAGNDFLNAQEDTNLTIPIRGQNGTVGLLDNDTAGPANEVNPPESQTIEMPLGQFPMQTARGGMVRVSGDSLIYTPPGLYSGLDSFVYRIVDGDGLEAFGTVSIDVGGENDAPVFEGIDGEKDNQGQPIELITLAESKPDETTTTYNLNSWFSDPESDPLVFSVTGGNSAILEVDLDGSTLSLTRPAFAFGSVELTVIATDPSNFSTQETISVVIVNENDPPLLENELETVETNEDVTAVRQLSNIFSDPDGDDLDYVVSRLGSIIRPTPAQIANHPLVASIEFLGDQMRITPEPNQFGEVQIEIEATDGSFTISDAFDFIVLSDPDAPVANDDAYNVAIGSTLRILNPSDGLLRNDFDADGDAIEVDVATVVPPTKGTLQVSADGTFVYTSVSGLVGEADSFTYRIKDLPEGGTSRFSEFKTVTLTIGASQYKNPIVGNEADVNADGFVSPIDALRVLNFIARRGGNTGSVPVSEIGSPPPDFLDTDGNGVVSANDALLVINELGARQNNALGEGEGVGSAVTSSFVTLSTVGLPSRNIEIVDEETVEEGSTIDNARDALLTAGLEISSSDVEAIAGLPIEQGQPAVSLDGVDEALSLLMDEVDLN